MLRCRRCVFLRHRVLARTNWYDRSSRRRRHANVARFFAEETTVIDGMAGLVLPLMHHLVQQRVQCFIPPVSPNVATTHDNLRRLTIRRRGHVVTKSRAHSTRDTDLNVLERAIEVPIVVPTMPLGQTLRERRVIRMWRVRTTSARRPRDRKAKNALSREPTSDASLPAHERDDGHEHIVRRTEISLMHAKLATAIAHHYCAIPSNTTAIDAGQPERAKTREQLGRVSWRVLKSEIELVLRPRQHAA